MFEPIGGRRKRWAGWLAVALCIASTTTQAHHSFPATYVDGEKVTVEGDLIAFMFRNPHSYVHLNVEDKSGKPVRYAIEWGAAASLGRHGIDRSTLKPGDHVIINGLPARNPDERRVLLRTIERPSDGFRWGFEEDETFN